MLDFETAREELATWYRLGKPQGERAFTRFYQQWLFPQTKALASRSRLPDDLVDEVGQRLAARFADREAMLGLEANSATFWRQQIKWAILTVQREAGRAARRADASDAHGSSEDEQPEDRPWENLPSPDAGPHDLVAEAEQAELRTAGVRAALPTLTVMERLAYFVFTWPEHEALLTPADFAALETRTKRPEAELRATLSDALPFRESAAEWSRRTLVVLYPSDELESPDGMTRALDAYRKARTRAAERLQAEIRASFGGVAP